MNDSKKFQQRITKIISLFEPRLDWGNHFEGESWLTYCI